jgi:hypothetical protein
MPKDTAGFLAAAYTLFDNAASLAVLADYGYDTEKMQAEREKLVLMDASNQNQEAALDTLNEWVAQYRKIAKVALRGKKQLLEKIGIAARTSKTAAQRAAPKKAAATRAAKKAQE